MSERTNKGGATSGQKVPKSPKSKFRAKSQQEQTAESKLRMEKRGEQLDKAKKKLAKQKPPKKSGPVKKAGRAAGATVHGYVHGKLYEVEHENVGTESAHRSELVGEAALRSTSRYVKKQIREHPAKAVQKAESRHIKATADYRYRATVEAHPEMQKGGAVSRYIQKQKIKRQYAKQAREAAKQTAKAAEKTAVTTEKLAARAVAFVKRHPVGVLLFLACFLLLVLMQSCMSSAVTIGNGVVGAIGASTYAAEDADLRGAEAAYCGLEAELQDYLDSYESTHDYDEYHFELDDIEHDPYVLLSIISAIHEGAWTVDEVQGTLQMLFEKQYILTETVVTERRYYLETDTWTDEEGNTHTDTYRVYYDYYICTVTLENFNLSHLPIYIMGEDQLSRYALYMSALGNRPDLFPSSPYVAKYTADPVEHEIPEAYLADETFAAILEEAEKYIGYPYVWGGYKPSTSFDCSGFVSYVYNQCGWDFGRLGAQGLYNISRRTSSPRPGDLVFFTGTYDTPGVSHVGIYVGDGWMLHCGDPIGYANLNTSYWQSHFYAYGRLS
ncbi:C40 family peptidase [Provencibacterium massiliense]|uniref:C40 family peptidase n=1 Tax=Provencibacterium massiliense TaxID=1841868 RepID=UPI00117A3435|nr:C40 family peptidase [Provencibacterium massiliense]